MKANKTSITIGAVLFVVVVLIYMYSILPAYNEITRLTKAIADKKTDYDKKTALVEDLKALKKSYLEIDKKDEDKLGRVLPHDENIINLLPELEVVLIQNGLNIGNMNFESFADSKTAVKKTPKSIKGEAKPVKIMIEAVGSYESFRNFLTGIEWNERLMDITDIGLALQLGKAVQEGAPPEQEKFNYKIELYAYWMQ